MAEVFEVDGWEELTRAIARQPEVAVPIILDSMNQVGAVVTGRVKSIPPAGPGNQKGRVDAKGRPMGFYERGRGYWYPVKGAVTLGPKIGKSHGAMAASIKTWKATSVAGYKLGKARSEQLSRSFSWSAPAANGDGSSIDVTVGNNASYTAAVTGPKMGTPHQSAVMAQIGWVSIDDAIANSDGDINQICQDALDRLAKDFSGGANA